MGGLNRYDEKKNNDYVQYFKAWNESFNYKGFNLDMNNDIEFECMPNATYGTKKEISNQYLHSVHKGSLDYVKNVLNRNNATHDKTPSQRSTGIVVRCGPWQGISPGFVGGAIQAAIAESTDLALRRTLFMKLQGGVWSPLSLYRLRD